MTILLYFIYAYLYRKHKCQLSILCLVFFTLEEKVNNVYTKVLSVSLYLIRLLQVIIRYLLTLFIFL